MPAQVRTLRAGLLILAAAALHFVPCAKAQSDHPVLVGVDYTFVRTNILPGCNCIALNGGGVQLEYRLGSHIAALADVTAAHRSGITPDSYSLTQLTYTFGARYFAASASTPLEPFVDLAFGGARALGKLSPANSGVGGSSNAFAMQAGGGFHLKLGGRWVLQPLQAEYMLTSFENTASNRQNDLRLSTGLLFRLGRNPVGQRGQHTRIP